MINDDQKLRVMCEERSTLRPAILAMQLSMHRAMFVLVTVAGIMIGVYWDDGVISDTDRGTVMFLLSQVEFILALFVVGLVAHQNVATSYIAALETKINSVANEPLNLFESDVSRWFYRSPQSTFWWVKLLIFMFFLSVFVAVGYTSVNTLAVRIVLTIEIIVFVLLLRGTMKEVCKVQTHARASLASRPEQDCT